MAKEGGTGTAEAAVYHVSPQRGVIGPRYFNASFACASRAVNRSRSNSSPSWCKQPSKSPLRVRFSRKPPDVVTVPIPSNCNFSQQCYRSESDLSRGNASLRHGLSDPVTDEQAILSEIAGGRARARALRLAVVVSGLRAGVQYIHVCLEGLL